VIRIACITVTIGHILARPLCARRALFGDRQPTWITAVP
jgi:hypothetical protein